MLVVVGFFRVAIERKRPLPLSAITRTQSLPPPHAPCKRHSFDVLSPCFRLCTFAGDNEHLESFVHQWHLNCFRSAVEKPASTTSNTDPLFPFSLFHNPQRTCAARIWAWCCRGRRGDKDNSDALGLGKEGAEADGGTRLPSWAQTEAVPTTTKQKGMGCDTQTFERDTRDPKPESLLWQQHIRVLLVIDALYSVCTTN